MREADYGQFTAMLDQVCGLLSKGQHKPDAQASALWFRTLVAYELEQVRAAFDAHVRCPDRGRFVPVPADIIAKIHAADGRPSSEEAWAIAVKAADESASVTWTDEIAEAWGIALPIWRAGDEVGARMAFREAYARLVGERRCRPARWWPSLGHDAQGREPEVERAAAAGLLEHGAVPMLQAPDAGALSRLAKDHRAPPHVREALLALRERFAGPIEPKPAAPPEPAPKQRQYRTPDEGARGPDLLALGIVAVKRRELAEQGQ